MRQSGGGGGGCEVELLDVIVSKLLNDEDNLYLSAFDCFIS